ncbi:putative C2H2 type zinc finger domain-containing protein [Seiridium unicorne]|uniref:C2H2 type zinc finger domain-containing protein n=1 Tax=Seiridium unicorne TaxID=138068 RepID=A0ABR2VGB0_9PEZI
MKRSREPEEEAQTAASSPAAITDETSTTISQPPEVRVTKIAELDESAIDDSTSSITMKCSLPGHKEPLVFKSYAEKNFPSEHFLNLHIEECHDAFAAVLREKGEHTYSCLVEGCDRKCGTPQKRRMHLIDKHMYPKNYFFAVTKEGIDGRSSLLLEGGHHRRKSSASQAGGYKVTGRRQSLRQTETAESGLEVHSSMAEQGAEEAPDTVTRSEEDKVDTDMADLTSAMSTLQFVPTSCIRTTHLVISVSQPIRAAIRELLQSQQTWQQRIEKGATLNLLWRCPDTANKDMEAD